MSTRTDKIMTRSETAKLNVKKTIQDEILMKDLYLTSTNKDKVKVATQLSPTFNIIQVTSDSGIEGGQPYGLEETKQGCINRTNQFKNDENFISIENGFVKHDNTNWYDIAYIYLRINNNYYSAWSNKRWFPKELYNDTTKLIEYFKETRFNQLNDCLFKLMIQRYLRLQFTHIKIGNK